MLHPFCSPLPWAVCENEYTEGWGIVDANGQAVARYLSVRCYESCTIYEGMRKEDVELIVETVNKRFADSLYDP